MNKEHVIPAVEKTLSLLSFLGSKAGGATQAELASELDITMSTCYRILQTLNKHDWVRRGEGARYDISGGILSAAGKMVSHTARFANAQPVLERLAYQTGLSCKLSVRVGDEQMTVLRAESPEPMSVSGKVGARFPIVEGTVGAALLCSESPESIRRLSEVCQESIDEKADPESVLARIAQIKAKGYCSSLESSRWQIDAISCPVPGEGGKPAAALTLVSFKGEMRKRSLEDLAKALLFAASECARAVVKQ